MDATALRRNQIPAHGAPVLNTSTANTHNAAHVMFAMK
jgi:hypothetical protein